MMLTTTAPTGAGRRRLGRAAHPQGGAPGARRRVATAPAPSTGSRRARQRPGARVPADPRRRLAAGAGPAAGRRHRTGRPRAARPPAAGVPLRPAVAARRDDAGKAMAQAGHAAQLGYRGARAATRRWRAASFPLAVRTATPAAWAARSLPGAGGPRRRVHRSRPGTATALVPADLAQGVVELNGALGDRGPAEVCDGAFAAGPAQCRGAGRVGAQRVDRGGQPGSNASAPPPVRRAGRSRRPARPRGCRRPRSRRPRSRRPSPRG